MLLIRFFGAICFTAFCAAQDPQNERPLLYVKSAWLEVFPSEKVQFTCNFSSNSNWNISWYRDEELILISSSMGTWAEFTLTAEKQYSGNYSCIGNKESDQMNTSRSNQIYVKVYDPPTPSLKWLSSWSDVFENETVEFNCSLDSSDWKFTWYRNNEKLLEDKDGSSYRIDSVMLTDEGTYTCKAHHKYRSITSGMSNSAEVKVYKKRPTPSLTRNYGFDLMYVGEMVNFTCTVDVASDWQYKWFKDKNPLPDKGSNISITLGTSNAGKYSCAAIRGGKTLTDSSKEIVQHVLDPPTPSLKWLSSWSDVFENETVEFNCSLDSSDWKFTWYRNNQELLKGRDKDKSSYRIDSVMLTDEGTYTCKAHHKYRSITSGMSNSAEVKVYKKRPTPSLTRNYGFDLMYVGEMVNFTCTVDVASDWQYKWFKDKNPLPDKGSNISITLGTSNAGKYSCAAIRGGKTLTDSSKEIVQHVLEIPAPSLKKITQWLDVFPTESVKLTCGLGEVSNWTYTWQKDGQKVQADKTLSFESNGSTLLIASASADHKGQYICRGHIQDRSVITNFSSGLQISVYDNKPNVKLTQDPEYQTMFRGESVTFKCDIKVFSGWEYLWYKDDKPLNVSLNMYKINPVQTSNAGSYKCRGKRGSDQPFFTDFSEIKDLDIKAEQPEPSITRQPDTDRLYTGESMSYECKVEISSGWDYQWYKDNKIHSHSSHLKILNVSAISGGNYKCMATRQNKTYKTQFSGNNTLNISEIPVPILKQSSQYLDVFPTETVKLSCATSSERTDWTYTWYRDGEEVQADDTVTFDSDKTTLTINSASASHRGDYKCSGKFKSRPVLTRLSPKVQLHVYDKKPNVRLTQTPEHEMMHTGDSVYFNCHNNVSTGWEYVWYKDDVQFTRSGNNFSISSVAISSRGSYKCQVKRGKNTVFHSESSNALKLKVEERPQAKVTLLTGWSEVFSTDTLLLKCEVENNNDVWNYTWFKAGTPISLLSAKHAVTPQNDPEQSLYTCQGIRTGRPSYSKPSNSFKTKNLLLKRRVLLSISGCIFFGIIAVFLGCIALRVMRKPANDEYKPDEANLFLTMAQLKNCADAPCPLVDYVTEEALNAPSKEEEENGTICSETIPLPISREEDQDVKTENNDKEENNGGLVSFKQ
ncbi:basement membrane-specific heparan sulfate proteoglycan core protein-like isoform X1 [Channa argus]|uniref:basement membrane-specific heparan sulfate proteoglycan core protein-like isoform X1 n=1 Tax=Channa argus TaxID=215402 RepID=UPI00351FEB54